jgi:triosephosphate isomerase
MSRKALIAGNWKLNCLQSEAVALARAVVDGCNSITDREVMVAPVFTVLGAVRQALDGSNVGLGAQDLYWEASGAFTGEVSAPMLRDVGCTHVIIGHSERRQHFGETDYTVAKKVSAAVDAGLVPVVCVGETLDQRDAGATFKVIQHQVAGGLVGLSQEHFSRLVIAYEPVWAIGTGRTATPEQAEEVHARIRKLLADMFNPAVASVVRILYGGSVKPDNVDKLMSCPNVDGALVGGASLKPDDFLRIVNFQGTTK